MMTSKTSIRITIIVVVIVITIKITKYKLTTIVEDSKYKLTALVEDSYVCSYINMTSCKNQKAVSLAIILITW